MDDSNTTPGFDIALGPFGQQPSLNIYTQITSCYALPESVSYPDLIDNLRDGLRLLSANFPWLAGQIIKTATSENDSDVFRIRPLDGVPRLSIQDLREDVSTPTMNQMREARFPFGMLDEKVVAPIDTFPNPSMSPIPVFAMQATIITGGFLLTFLAHHQAMDITALGQITHLLSKACNGQSYTEDEFTAGNLSHQNIIPLLEDDWKPVTAKPDDAKSATQDQVSEDQATTPQSPHCSWAYFAFNSESLAALKTLATNAIDSSSGFVSTDDSLSAFIWQSVARTRLARSEPTKNITFARAVDPRRFLNIAITYPGLVQNMTYHTRTLQQLVESPLGEIASNLRAAVEPRTSTLAHDTRALATLLHRASDKSKIDVTAKLDLSTDIMLSSWTKERCYDFEFNLGLGKPEAVRRPQFSPVESLMYLMPKRRDGEVVLGLCLRDEDMDQLRADTEFSRYASFIG